MKTLLTLIFVATINLAAFSQDAAPTSAYSYAYISIEGKLLSKKLRVEVDLGDTPEQIAASEKYSETLTNTKSYAAILNYMVSQQYELVETLERSSSKNGTGGTDGIIFIMKKKNQHSSLSKITDRKWKLIELGGKPVDDKINGKEPFIKLQQSDNRYTGTGGCNGLGGSFTLKDNGRIEFTLGMSTMMACENMEIEQGLNKALEAADNYTIKGNTLSLNKARMAPLARFVEVTD